MQCSAEPKETAVIFNMQEQMIEIRAWNKLSKVGEVDSCRLWGEQKETL